MIRPLPVTALMGIYSRAITGSTMILKKNVSAPPSAKKSRDGHGPFIDGAPDCVGTSELLERQGVNLGKVARRYPFALRYDAAKTEAVIRALDRHSINIGKAVNRYPKLLGIGPEMLDARFHSLAALFSERMLQQAIGDCLSLLSYPPSTLERNMAMLTTFGLDVGVVVKRYPRILTRTEHAIGSRITFFREIGLEPVRIINGAPHVTGYDVERNLRPTVEYITKDMGRSLEEINRSPRSFGTSLEHRLKPRHEYLMLYGKRKDYSLGVICSTTDDRFVLLTDRSLKHYCEWLAHNR